MDDFLTLVQQAKSGDDAAYGELVRRFQDMAYGYAYGVLGNFQLAEDAAQEAFVEAYRYLPDLVYPQAFPSWLKRIIYKHCDRITRRKRPVLTPLEAAYEVAAPGAGPEAVAEHRDLQARVLDAITALPASQRTVTTLYYINGYSQQEIAAFLDVPTSTVKSRLHTSRRRLKERMMDMVRETLQSQALPESFTEATLARAVQEAAALNKAHQFDEAEALLRDVLDKTPSSAPSIQAGALRELNRTLMWGQYEDERFDERWDELVANGRAILASGDDDEQVYRELGDTLMYIPRMPEAVEHLEAWIAAKGPNPERVGKLAWARACISDYDKAEARWTQHLALANADVLSGAMDGLVDTVSYTCLTLVDAFAAAGRHGLASRPARRTLTDRAARITEAGWDFCRDRGDITLRDFRGDTDWLGIFHETGLPLDDAARFLIDKWSARSGPEAEGIGLCLRGWLEPPETLLDDWLAWVRGRVAEEDWDLITRIRGVSTGGFRARGLAEAQTAFGAAVWELLAPAPDRVRRPWQWGRFDVFAYFEAGDYEDAARIAQRATEEMGPAFGGAMQIQAAAALGEPTPPQLVRLVEEHGIEAVDSYGMSGWYLVAREAAKAGDKATAVDALRRTLSYWTNPPLGYLWLWEQDTLWGPLAGDPEVKALFAKKRRRVGPIYGQLHYFPGW